MISKRKKLLVVLGDGGHTAETVELVMLLGKEYDFAYVAARTDRISRHKIPIQGPIYEVALPRAKDDKVWVAAWKLGLNFWQVISLLPRIQPDAILGSGAAITVPVAVIGELLGAKIIFVETACRVAELSLTGKIISRIADLFFAQWEQLHRRYPSTIYAGRLL